MPDTEGPQATMFRWLDPVGLLTLGASVVLATEFGHYADRRELEAALSPTGEPRGRTPYATDEIWVDFVSDVGDAYDPTHTVARLIAGDELTLPDPRRPGTAAGAAAGAEAGAVPADRIPRGSVLLMGGDQAYPWGTLPRYRRNTLLPYGDALAPPAAGGPSGLRVFAIPGNHDWYDGLNAFLRVFTRGKTEEPKYVGGWEVRQQRSYFARRLTPTWWIWGLDTQLSDDLDRPQREYFEARSRQLVDGDNVVIMTATPCWAETDKPSFEPGVCRWLDEFESGTITARGARLRLLLSGDSHHYAHHVRTRDSLHAFTAGGGGAYTSDTHHLVDRVPAADRGVFAAPPPDRAVNDTGFRPLAAWPDPVRSKAMAAAILRPIQLLRNNWYFGLLVGAIYLLYALAAGRWYQHGLGAVGLAGLGAAELGIGAFGAIWEGLIHSPSAWIGTVALFLGLCGFSRARPRGTALALGGLHTAGHVVAAVLVTWLGVTVARPMAGVPPLFTAFVVAVIVLVVGALVGSWVMSLYLYLADRTRNCNATELLAAQRYTTYKNFLRLHVVGDELTVYPVGVPASGRYVDPWGTKLPDPGLAPYELIEAPVDCPWRGRDPGGPWEQRADDGRRAPTPAFDHPTEPFPEI